ncbi:MAG: FecR domain-containing protein [Sphingobium sp.]
MAADPRQADREAADWFLLLNEEPDDSALQERFEQWLDADPAHVDAWARISDTGAALASASLEEWNIAAPVHAAPAPRRKHGARRWTRLPRRRFVIGTAAAAAVAFAAFPSISLYLQADHMTDTAQVESVRLADGSTVRLGPDSAIAVEYESGKRQVRLLAGRAWFEVEPDPARPFRVTAGHVGATVLGTGFEVRRAGAATSVAVGHGRVRVSDDSLSPARQRELTAGQWVDVGPDHAMHYGTDRPDTLGAWRQGRLMVRNRAIADVIEDVRPWYRGRIVLTDRSFGQRRVTGFYDLRDPSVTIESLIHPAGGKVTHITPWLMIVSGS